MARPCGEKALQAALERVGEILAGLPGIVSVRPLAAAALRRVVEIETAHQASAKIPVRNLGIDAAASRDACVVLLKDGRFRPPPAPTVYLVEDAARDDGEHVMVIEGRSYRVVGEEIVDEAAPRGETALSVSDTFVIFPDRRSGAQVPCAFMLPPLPFAELEERKESLGIARIVSVSPSIAADMFLRESFGFPPTNAFATLVVGFDVPAAPPGRP